MKLHCENLVKKYGIRTVVKGVSMEINQGEIVGFLGPNGAGKTTSFYMITGQIVPNGGRVFLDDEDITELPMYKRAQKGVGYLPQEASVFRKMSVEDNIMSVMEMSDMSKAERQERLEDLINEFNLSKVRKSLGIQLSGGERRRCEIARALATKPKLLLLDEPAAGMNPNETAELMETIRFVRDHFGMTILLIEHDMKLVSGICERLTVLNFGQVLCTGPTQEVLSNPEVIKAYLGE